MQALRLANLASLVYCPRRRATATMKRHRMLADVGGQAMTEYLIVTVFLIPMVVFITPLRVAVQSYLRFIYFMISLSIF